RTLVQVLVTGTRIVGRAFAEAYKQAAENAAARKAGAAGAAGARGGGDPLTRQTGMTLDEATQILNVGTETEMTEIIKKYEHLFKVNDQKTGGSLYLQSKVVRAKERIELQRAMEAAKSEGAEGVKKGAPEP
ncbi:Pam16-domain-containing protein, partial [Thamnocephalis sphaerospora]